MNSVTGINVTEEVSLITFNNLPAEAPVIAEIFERFAESDINIDMISQTAPHSRHVSISFTVSDDDIVKVLELVKTIRDKYSSIKAMVSSGNCKIQLFGEEMRHRPGIAARAISSVADAGVEITLITTSEVDISLLVHASHLDTTLSSLENDFGLKAER